MSLDSQQTSGLKNFQNTMAKFFSSSNFTRSPYESLCVHYLIKFTQGIGIESVCIEKKYAGSIHQTILRQLSHDFSLFLARKAINGLLFYTSKRLNYLVDGENVLNFTIKDTFEFSVGCGVIQICCSKISCGTIGLGLWNYSFAIFFSIQIVHMM